MGLGWDQTHDPSISNQTRYRYKIMKDNTKIFMSTLANGDNLNKMVIEYLKSYSGILYRTLICILNVKATVKEVFQETCLILF